MLTPISCLLTNFQLIVGNMAIKDRKSRVNMVAIVPLVFSPATPTSEKSIINRLKWRRCAAKIRLLARARGEVKFKKKLRPTGAKARYKKGNGGGAEQKHTY
jgi:hypothetical protein